NEAGAANVEVRAAVDATNEVAPAMSSASAGVEMGAASFIDLRPAASGAAGAVGETADEIARASANAAIATEELGKLQAVMNSFSPARIAVTPVTAGAAPVADNANLPGYSGGGYTGDVLEDEIAGFVTVASSSSMPRPRLSSGRNALPPSPP